MRSLAECAALRTRTRGVTALYERWQCQGDLAVSEGSVATSGTEPIDGALDLRPPGELSDEGMEPSSWIVRRRRVRFVTGLLLGSVVPKRGVGGLWTDVQQRHACLEVGSLSRNSRSLNREIRV